MKPRGYISWSQLDLWERDKSAYIRKYFEGEEQAETIFTIFGKETHEAIQSWEIDAPFFWNPEMELTANIDWVECLGKVDSISDDFSCVVEYKTSVREWTQEKADNHGQCAFLAMLVQAKTQKIPLISLVYIPTAVNGGKITQDGAISEFQVVITQDKIDDIIARIKKARTEIDNAYETWVSMKEQGLWLEKFLRIRELQEEIEKLEEEKELLVSEVKEMLTDWDLKTIDVDGVGKFSLVSQKRYKYPDNELYNTAKQAFDIVKKNIEKELDKNGSFTETVSLRFTKAK